MGSGIKIDYFPPSTYGLLVIPDTLEDATVPTMASKTTLQLVMSLPRTRNCFTSKQLYYLISVLTHRKTATFLRPGAQSARAHTSSMDNRAFVMLES